MVEKILSLEKVEDVVRHIRNENKTIVFTNGCFDVIHSGHVRYLIEAKQLGDDLILGVNSDSSIKRLKGESRPINNEEDRLIVLAAFEMIDFLVIFNEDTPYNLIQTIKPDFLVKGGDWKEEQIVGSDIVKSYGGKVLSLPYHQGRSSTVIIEKMNQL